jgi:hypothetical protein
MNYHLLSVGVLLIFTCLGGIAFLSRRPDWLLMLIIIGLAFTGFNTYFASTVWTPTKIITAFGFLYILFLEHRWIKEIKQSQNGILWLLFWSWLASIILAYMIEPEGFQLYDDNLQGRSMRPLVQGYAYLSKISIFPLTLLALKSRKDIETFFNIYIWSALFASFVALYQLYVLQSGGTFMPILRAFGEADKEAAFVVAGVRLQRLYAFAGEPKVLAVFLLPALFAILSAITIKVPVDKPMWAKLWILLIIIFVYIFTFSTAGMIALVLGLVFIGGIFSMVQPTAITKMVFFSIIAFFALQSTFTFLVKDNNSVSAPNSSLFADVFYERSVGRTTDELETRHETIALDYIWNDNYSALLLGLGPGMYNFHIKELHYGRGVQQINSGWVVLLLDTGIVGSSILLCWIAMIVQRALWMTRFWSRIFDWRAFLLIAPAIASLLGASFVNLGVGAFDSIILFAGVTEALRLRLE